MTDTRKPLRPDQHYCSKCGAKCPIQYTLCFKCHSEQPARITDRNAEGWGSVKDYNETQGLGK